MSQPFGLLQPFDLATSAVSTSTTEPRNLARGLNYSLQLTVTATGTSGVGGVVIAQCSNDRVAWFAVGSATATATQAATTTSVVATALMAQRQDMAWLRVVMQVTGTGRGRASFAQ